MNARKAVLIILLLALSITAAANARDLLLEGPSDLDNPQDMAVDHINGFIYMTDTGNHRFQIFTSAGQESTWVVGEEGADEGEFDEPRGIAVNSEGFIYVADTGNNRIQRFDTTVGKNTDDPIDVLDVYDNLDGLSLDEPHGLGIDEEDRIYIADTGHARVRVIDSGGGVVGEVGAGPSDDLGGFIEPVDVAVCPLDGRIFVLDRGFPTVQIFAPFDDGAAYLDFFGASGDGLGYFDAPLSLDLDHQCNVYVADTGNNRVQLFSSEGGFIEVFGENMGIPSGIAVETNISPSGEVYVANSGADSLQLYEWINYDDTGDDDPDSDGDGLPDQWELEGIDFNDDGSIDLDLPAMGAAPDRKDVFVEVDYMEDRQPAPEDFDPVIEAYAAAPVSNPDGSTGITLHIELSDEVPFIERIILWSDFDLIKGEFFGSASQRSAANADDILTAKAFVYHYAIVGNLICGAIDDETPPNCIDDSGYGGMSDFGPNFFVVTDNNEDVFDFASTFMHELGHSLGLGHGGGDGVNCKPNYLSIMNYGYGGALVDTQTNQNVLDYSREALPTLDESALDESAGVGDGTLRVIWTYAPFLLTNDLGNGPLDWDNDGQIDAGPVAVDVSAVPIRDCRVDEADYPNLQILEGHDDWNNLDYTFRNNPGAYAFAHAPFVVPDEITADEARLLRRCIETGFCTPPQYEYAPKMVCGLQRDRADLSLGVGWYGTTVNIHNPNLEDARLFVKLALAAPPGDLTPGDILPLGTFTLAYDQAMAVNCNDVLKRLFNGTFPASYIDGFLIIQSDSSLDVTGVYSVSSLDRAGNPAPPSDVEIVPIGERVREQTIDLEVEKRVAVQGGTNTTPILRYVVEVTNNGPIAAENVAVSDRLDVELGRLVALFDFTATHGSGWTVDEQTLTSAALSATIPTLEVGETARLEFSVIAMIDRAALRLDVVNTAEVTSEMPENDLQNNVDVLETSVGPAGDG